MIYVTRTLNSSKLITDVTVPNATKPHLHLRLPVLRHVVWARASSTTTHTTLVRRADWQRGRGFAGDGQHWSMTNGIHMQSGLMKQPIRKQLSHAWPEGLAPGYCAATASSNFGRRMERELLHVPASAWRRCSRTFPQRRRRARRCRRRRGRARR